MAYVIQSANSKHIFPDESVGYFKFVFSVPRLFKKQNESDIGKF